MIVEESLLDCGVSERDAHKWLPYLNEALLKYDIDTPFRQAGFISQVCHESGNLQFVVENLNYSVAGLQKVFSKYFTKKLAEEYERQPERIANRVYANRMGNGDEQSGDGWKYRGRGLIQLTGKTNYMLFMMEVNNEALIKPNSVAEPDLACESAAWFWNRNDLNSFADKQDVRGMTRKINGGFNGLEDRQIKYNKVLATLK